MHVRRDVLHKIYIRLKLEMQEEEEEGEGGENEQQFFFLQKVGRLSHSNRWF